MLFIIFCLFVSAQHLGCTCFRIRFSSWSLTFLQHSPQVIAHTCIFLILSRTAPKNYALCVVLVPFADREIGARSDATYILGHRLSSCLMSATAHLDCSNTECLDWLRNTDEKSHLRGAMVPSPSCFVNFGYFIWELPGSVVAAFAHHAPRESLCYFMRLHRSRKGRMGYIRDGEGIMNNCRGKKIRGQVKVKGE